MNACPTCGIEIINHPADRCLDALVAERVMGIVSNVGVVGWMLDSRGYTVRVPEYSTDIAAAWQVVEKLDFTIVKVDEGWMVGKLDINAFTNDSGVVYGCIYDPGLAETAPLAICRAALLAVMDGDK